MRQTGADVAFAVRLQPRAKRSAITGEAGDALKLAVAAPPIEGRANRACIELLAEVLRVPRSSIRIAAGESSRNKLIRIAGADALAVQERLRQAVRENL